MAAINSHRKRQAYGDQISRGTQHYGNKAAPSGASTIMPDKSTTCDPWAAPRRTFATIEAVTKNRFLGRTLKVDYVKDPNTGVYGHVDVLTTSPGGMVDHGSKYNRTIYTYTVANSTNPIAYSLELSSAYQHIRYSRSNTGLLISSYKSYKKMGYGHKQVISVSDKLGGNIKSRATTLKWVGGMWRAK